MIDGDKVRDEGDHYYDQIAVRAIDPRFRVEAGGIFNLFDHVFGEDDIETYRADFEAARERGVHDQRGGDDEDAKYYTTWRTFQISDHNPLWVKIQTDFTRDYLEKMVKSRDDDHR